MKTVELEDLIGLHTLSAAESGYIKDNGNVQYTSMKDCNYLSFVLDGKKYTAIEDPSDGYRSSMDRLTVSRGKLKNILPDTKVMVVFSRDRYSESGSLLWFYAVENGKLVMEVGTDSYDSYYPAFVGHFNPENLPANTLKEEAGK
jgi:hypothetical protein